MNIYAIYNVNILQIPVSLKNYRIQPRSTASILIIIEGTAEMEGTTLKPGTAIFLPADNPLEVTNITVSLLIYQGLANI